MRFGSCRRWVPRLLLSALLAVPSGTAAGAPAGDGEPGNGEPGNGEILVSIDRPDPFRPAFGNVEIEAVVGAGEDIERVVFYVDGVVVGTLTEAPYRLEARLGDDVSAHRFEVIAFGVSGATGSTSITTPAMRIDDEVSVDLQQLYVTLSRDGIRVPDLQASDFEVFDEGARQELVTFARGDIPFTAVVLVDSSVSMRGAKLTAALAGARTFFEGMRQLDQGKLLVFSDRLLHATPFTSFPAVLTAGLGRVEARGGTALSDHAYLALKQLEERQGRRVILLLSDGVDSHSVLSMQDVLDNARRSQALIYWLRLPYSRGAAGKDGLPLLSTAWRNSADYREQHRLLKQTVEESGGQVRSLASIDDIGPTFRDILEELRDQYVLGYYPHLIRHDGSWRRVRVRVARPDLDVRCRDGYLDL